VNLTESSQVSLSRHTAKDKRRVFVMVTKNLPIGLYVILSTQFWRLQQ